MLAELSADEIKNLHELFRPDGTSGSCPRHDAIPQLLLNHFSTFFHGRVRVTQSACELLTGFPERLFIVDDRKPGA
jgi:hypothetical protein